MFIKNQILRDPDGGTGGGNGAAALETLGTIPPFGAQRADFDAALLKMFPEERRAAQPPGGTGEIPNLSETAADETATATVEETETAETTETATVEETETAETTETETTETTGDEAVEHKVLAKRVGRLLRKLEEQDQEIQNLRTQRVENGAAAPDAVARITKPADLQALERTTNGYLKQAQGLIRQLGYAPKNVEKALRVLAAANPVLAERFKGADAEGNPADDYSVERMAEVLTEVEGNLTETLEAIPQRQQVLEQRANVSRILREPEVLQVAGFVNDPESEGYNQVRELMGRSADLRNAPNGEALAIAAVLGMRLLNPAINKAAGRLQGKAPAAGAKAAGKGPSRLPGLPSGGAGKINSSKYKAARANFEKSPSRKNLEDVLANI